MSFSADIKNELCRTKTGKKCCAFAELYGIILFASVLSVSEIKILTSCISLERKINRLCEECGFSHVPWTLKGSNGHYSISLTEGEWVARILNSFDFDVSSSPVVHFKGWNVENDCCRNSFLRGMFPTYFLLFSSISSNAQVFPQFIPGHSLEHSSQTSFSFNIQSQKGYVEH